MKRLVVAVVLFGTVISVLFMPYWWRTKPSEHRAFDELPQVQGHAYQIGYEFPVYISDTKERLARWGPGDKVLSLEHVDLSTGDTRVFWYGSSFRIEDLAAQKYATAKKTETYYVLGRTDAGEQVIERWIHKPKKVQLPGQPLQFVLKRKAIWSGGTLGKIEYFQVEPSGDYLVLVHNDGSNRHVSQMGLPSGLPITTVIDGSQGATGMEPGVISVSRALHSSEGLLWMIQLLPTQPVAVLVIRDLNGDGILDDWMGLDQDTRLSVYPPYFVDDPWIDDFIVYTN